MVSMEGLVMGKQDKEGGSRWGLSHSVKLIEGRGRTPKEGEMDGLKRGKGEYWW